ncbi:MAG: hypothetical protein KBF83_11310 [Pyrinomonadaceae bacterium]|nr:hypothetical protein [Pyrinomonadaceae bacterium]MBP9110132.1 hypothetical protein [Pyrinomonadaceae bacterium]
MFKPLFTVAAFLFLVVSTSAQNTGPDAMMVSLSIEIGKISRSVSLMSEKVSAYVDKMDKAPTAGGSSVTERQQKIAAGLQLLANAEQLLIVRQRFQIELVEKLGTTRTRLAQVERDVMPGSIDRSVQYEGTTKTEELRETRRTALNAERSSLQTVVTQLTSTLADTNESVREAQSLVNRLRRQYIPELEREIDK